MQLLMAPGIKLGNNGCYAKHHINKLTCYFYAGYHGIPSNKLSQKFPPIISQYFPGKMLIKCCLKL